MGYLLVVTNFQFFSNFFIFCGFSRNIDKIEVHNDQILYFVPTFTKRKIRIYLDNKDKFPNNKRSNHLNKRHKVFHIVF